MSLLILTITTTSSAKIGIHDAEILPALPYSFLRHSTADAGSRLYPWL